MTTCMVCVVVDFESSDPLKYRNVHHRKCYLTDWKLSIKDE